MDMSPPPPLAAMSGVCKQFGSVTANDNVDLEIRAGEVLALLGENGAGKSTLMKVLYGFYRADGGEIRLDGKPVNFQSPREAMASGIGMVFQQFSLVPALSILENLLAAFPEAPWLQNRGSSRVNAVLDWLKRLAPNLDPARPVRELAVGERQLVELAKVLNLNARVVILDEPTSVLTPAETERLYGFIRSLIAEGKAVVLITHKLADIAACADRIVVMRGGRVVDRAMTSERKPEELVAAMVGREKLSSLEAPPRVVGSIAALQVRDMSANVHGTRIQGVSFEMPAGEILGIAGVSGNGQYALAEALAGLTPVTHGDVILGGVSIASREADGAISNQVAYVPERPLDNAVVAGLDLGINLALRQVCKMSLFPRRRAITTRADELIKRFDVRPPRAALPAAALSGGNLQKLVIARELSDTHRLVIASYPTMGLDVLATQAVYRSLFDRAAEGACVVWISEELDDLLRYAHRIAVIYGGRIAGIVRREDATRQMIGRWMAGGEHGEAA
jgi:general nucleoside transport system ATP-binding protein